MTQLKQGMQRAACALLLGMGILGAARAQQFDLFAGGALGDGGPKESAFLHGAADVAFDATGVAYVTQLEGNRIRRIATDGTVTTVVGGTRGFSGDGGPASAAAIDAPRGIAIDAAGNLYFSDTGNRRIRRIAPDGTISTVAGNGAGTYSGDGGQATSAGLMSPAGIGLDAAGNLYIADTLAHRVRKVATDGTITTFAGDGMADATGNGGPATAAGLQLPQDVAVDVSGVVYIVDTGNHAIRRVMTDGTIDTLADSWDWEITDIGVAPNGHVWWNDNAQCQLWRWEGVDGIPPVMAAGWPPCVYQDERSEGVLAENAFTSRFGGMAFDADGNLTYVDLSSARLRKIIGGRVYLYAGRNGAIEDGSNALGAPLSEGAAIAFDINGDVLLAEANHNRRIRRITRAGKLSTYVGNGNIFSPANNCSGVPCNALWLPVERPTGLVPDAAGNLYIADAATNRVYVRRTDGLLYGVTGFDDTSRYSYSGNKALDSEFLGDGKTAEYAIVQPGGLARDSAGNVYIADEGFNRIRKIGTDGVMRTIAGTGLAAFAGDGGAAVSAKLRAPKAIVVDATGNVYFSDSGNRRIRRIATNGVITTIAGNGQAGVSGDGGAATSAAIGVVNGLAFGANNVLWFTSEGRLRYIAGGVVRSIPELAGHYALGVAYRDGWLFVSTRDGLVYRANLIRRAHDYDGNARADILWHNNSTGANTIWKNASNATQQAVTTVTGAAWKIVGQGDFDGDLRADIVWRNVQTGANAIWKSGISTTQINMTGVTNQAWSIVGVGDFNRDGKSDLLWRNATTGQNTLWRSANSTTQSAVTTASLQWQVVGVADFDGDGVSDVLWRNTTTGANAIWRSGVASTAQAVTTVAVAWKVGGVGDFDGDGRADILWRNAATGQNLVWNAANGASVRTLVNAAAAWKLMAVGDYDGDGKADPLWRNTNTGANVYWRGADAAQAQTLVGVSGTAWTIVPVEFQQ